MLPVLAGDTLLRSLSFKELGKVVEFAVAFAMLEFCAGGVVGIADLGCFRGFLTGLSTLSFSVHLKIYFPVTACSGQSFR